MFPLFESSDAMLAVILCIVACAFWVQKFKIFKMIGPALFVIIAGVLLVNLRIVPAYTDVYGVISTYCIPFFCVFVFIERGSETDHENVQTAADLHCICSFSASALLQLFSVRFLATLWKKAGRLQVCLWEPIPEEAPI